MLQDGEYVTRISGKYGCDEGRNQEGIFSLIIHTNLCLMGYGPFGEGSNMKNTSNFSSPTLIDHHIVGFFARHHNFLESIGVFLQKVSFFFMKSYYLCVAARPLSLLF